MINDNTLTFQENRFETIDDFCSGHKKGRAAALP